MPSPTAILTSLTSITNAALPFAVAWHVAVAAGLLSLLAGFRLQRRTTALFMCAPLASVSVLAWVFGNPFNGLVFAVLTVVLAVLAFRVPSAQLAFSRGWPATSGAVMLAFAWFYPHFLDETHSVLAYAYAAPMGLIPCPTLSLAIGLTLLCAAPAGLTSANILAAISAFYGLWGTLVLGVVIDLLLLAGALGLFFAGRSARFQTAVPEPAG